MKEEGEVKGSRSFFVADGSLAEDEAAAEEEEEKEEAEASVVKVYCGG